MPQPDDESQMPHGRAVGSAVELLPWGADRTDRQLWLETRRQGITASEIPMIMGLSRYGGALTLYYRKLGLLPEDESGWLAQMGTALEPFVLGYFTSMTGFSLSRCGLACSAERPWMMATPDAVIGHVPVEAKTALSPDSGWGETGSSEVPERYRRQLLWQMLVLGADHGYLCVVFRISGEPRWYRVGQDSWTMAEMIMEAEGFLDRLAAGDPPPADGLDATTRALRVVWQADWDAPAVVCAEELRLEYAAALQARRDADDRHRLAANMIRLAMGSSARLVDSDGAIVATRRGGRDALYPGRNLVREDAE